MVAFVASPPREPLASIRLAVGCWGDLLVVILDCRFLADTTVVGDVVDDDDAVDDVISPPATRLLGDDSGRVGEGDFFRIVKPANWLRRR